MSDGERDDGGQAFPTSWGDDAPGLGMTLRDYFAGQAITGLLDIYSRLEPTGGPLGSFISAEAYRLADDMLEQRKR